MSDSEVFKIRPAGRHILTIGRDLIQDPYAAVVELVKNAYDADATKVNIQFSKYEISREVINGEEIIHHGIKICISDDGHGMFRSVVTDKWMVPSTDDKKNRKVSPKGRIMQGRKGIGRYASAILGNDLFLETVANGTKTSLLVNWNDFEKAEYLSDVDVLIETKNTNNTSGTTLLMTGDESFLNEWNERQFTQLQKELKKLMTPVKNTKTSSELSFDIYLTINGFNSFNLNNEKIEPFPLFDLYDYRISGKINNDGKGLLIYEMQKVRNSIPINIEFNYGKQTHCGVVEFDIRVFDREKEAIDDLINRGLKDESGNYVGKWDARRLLNENNGIGVYRNGFRIRPLGDPDFDWLELNKDRVQNPSKKIGSDQVIGIVSIEDEEKSGLIEKSARDGLKENNSYSALKALTKEIISKLEERRFIYRSKAGISRKTLKVEKEFEKLFSFDDLKKNVQSSLTRGKVDTKTSTEIMGAIDAHEKEQNAVAVALRETIAIYQGQVTLGKIVNVIIHEGRKPLDFFKNQIPIFKKYYEQYEDGKIDLLPTIYDKVLKVSDNSQILVNLFKKIDPLAAGKRGKKKPELIKAEIESDFSIFDSELKNIDWKVEISGKEDIQIDCWKQDIYSVFTNLIENSIFWMTKKDVPNKKISVYIHTKNDYVDYIDYKDTGPGIEKHLIESGVIFEPEFSTKTEGGTGLGLSIAGEAARRFGFDLQALYSETGAYFRLERLEDN
ncbi:MAG: sensor histidine kinase [Treponema sp.]|nr:sensor histidine kinase [Treponema sp.]